MIPQRRCHLPIEDALPQVDLVVGDIIFLEIISILFLPKFYNEIDLGCFDGMANETGFTLKYGFWHFGWLRTIQIKTPEAPERHDSCKQNHLALGNTSKPSINGRAAEDETYLNHLND